MASPVLQITDSAAQRIKTLLSQADKTVIALRVSVRARGCSGLSYTINYATEKNPLDEVVHDKDVTVFIDGNAVMFLIGSEMDFQDDGLQSTFIFRNPHEKGRCGCGESFQV